MDNKLIEHIAQLRHEPASVLLNDILAEFAAPKEHTIQNFKTGISRFIDVANMRPEEREHVYGSPFAGLYINHDLAQVWAEANPFQEPMVARLLDDHTTASWRCTVDEQNHTLEYAGSNPAQALNELLKGPAIIDCGMFCQLGIWFGLRNILGDDAFNARFGRKPFLITRSNYQAPTPGNERGSNPLFAFFSAEEPGEERSSVAIEHVFNDYYYALKHPGGCNGGQNCLIINGTYHIFAPLLENKGTREDVIAQLLQSYNDEQDANDEDILEILPDNPAFFQALYGSIYAFPDCTLAWVETLHKYSSFLASYILAMKDDPECCEKMKEVFGQNDENYVDCFIQSFAKPRDHQQNFEAFYAIPCIKAFFKAYIERRENQTIFEAYYRSILVSFFECREVVVEHTLSREEYRNGADCHVPGVSSYLHVDFNKILSFLESKPSVFSKAIPPTPTVASNVLETLFTHSSGGSNDVTNEHATRMTPSSGGDSLNSISK